MSGQLRLHPQPDLLGLAVRPRDDLRGIGLGLGATTVAFGACSLEQFVGLVRGVVDDGARLLFGDPQHLFEMTPVRRGCRTVGEFLGERSDATLGFCQLGADGGEIPLEAGNAFCGGVGARGALGGAL